MGNDDYSITFACHNAVKYTKLCIESLIKHNTPLNKIVVVDNGSSDETLSYLNQLPLGGILKNKQNLGCGVAWNQGILHQQAEWSVIMNNDILVSSFWIESLINSAKKNNLKIISPALIEGDLDYDFEEFANTSSKKMAKVLRLGKAHAVCLVVHQSVWMDIGYFQPNPNLWGFEDTLFFHAANKANIPMAITGSSWLHHFGSITQSEMKRAKNLANKSGLTGRYNYKLLNENWFKRKLRKILHKKTILDFQNLEMKNFGMTVHGIRKNGAFTWI